jgi:hypothetical protein
LFLAHVVLEFSRWGVFTVGADLRIFKDWRVTAITRAGCDKSDERPGFGNRPAL